MKYIYVLMCDTWGGSNYITQVLQAYKDEELAQRTAIQSQSYYKPCDVRYWVEKVEYEDLEG